MRVRIFALQFDVTLSLHYQNGQVEYNHQAGNHDEQDCSKQTKKIKLIVSFPTPQMAMLTHENIPLVQIVGQVPVVVLLQQGIVHVLANASCVEGYATIPSVAPAHGPTVFEYPILGSLGGDAPSND